MANWSNPTLTSTYTNFVTEVKDRDVEAAVWFEGMSPTNLPTNAKRLNTSTGRFEKWNGSAWVDAVATFTFPALTVAGVSTFTGVATFTANPVMNGGAANSVPYLNGSKVLTSGAALTFNGSTFTVKGGNAGQMVLDNAGEQFTQLLLQRNGTANTGGDILIDGTNSVMRIRSLLAGSMVFATSATPGAPVDGLWLNGNGVGVGVSPSAKFQVKVQTNANAWFRTTDSVFGSVSGGLAIDTLNDAGSALSPFGVRGNGVYINDGTGTTTFSGGNIGLGVPPSAWESSFKALQLTSGSLSSNSAVVALKQNTAFTSSGDVYTRNGAASDYYQLNGSHVWRRAASGTAGAGCALLDSLTLDANANLIGAGTGYWQLPRGTTAQRPTGASGMIRFNSDLNRYEGHNGSSWSSIGGGATGGGSDDIFYENGQTVTTNYTIGTNKNAMSAGPVTIASGITVTVPSGSNWVVV